MLVRLVYASRATDGVHAEQVGAILKASRARNQATGVTGLLCFCASSNVFLQVLEGGRAPINSLYNRIVADRRHRDPTLLAYEEIGERKFAGWSMGQVNMDRLNTALLLRYSESAALDPYALSGQAALGLFNELVATASVTGQG